MQHFDRERVPERVVHAKGGGAHGFFEVTEDVTQWTKASFMSQVGKRTPVFVRISTVAGELGSPETNRDPRGFALKMYTEGGRLRPGHEQHPGLLRPRRQQVQCAAFIFSNLALGPAHGTVGGFSSSCRKSIQPRVHSSPIKEKAMRDGNVQSNARRRRTLIRTAVVGPAVVAGVLSVAGPAFATVTPGTFVPPPGCSGGWNTTQSATFNHAPGTSPGCTVAESHAR
jgi:hypothetical protein